MTATGAAQRSWTDSLANTIFFAGFDSIEYLRWSGSRGLDEDVENHLVAPFLHEFTHHWCFNSLVGNSVAFTELRLHSMCGRAPELRGYCARLSLTLSALGMLLRPIAEGLALFAEFDLSSKFDDSQKVGTPLTAAEICFARARGRFYSKSMLGEMRHTPEVIDRKASIYLHKFEIEEGYLSGYMFIKWLYLNIQAKLPDIETEAFLAYVRCFFWEDPGLVRLMHSIDEDVGSFVHNLKSHVARRIDQLRLATDMRERMDEFWESWSRPGWFHAGHGLFVDPADEATALSVATQAINGASRFLLDRGVDRDFVPVSEIIWLTTQLADLRRFVVVARAPACVEITDDNVTFVLLAPDGNSIRVHLPCIQAIAPGPQELFAVVSNFAEYLVLLVKSDTDIRVVNSIGKFDSEGAEDVIMFVAQVDRASKCIDALRRDFEERGYPSLRSRALDSALEATSDSMLDLYLKLITMRGCCNPEVAAAEEKMLRENGIRSLFSENPLALRTIAAASMAHWLEGADRFNFDTQVEFIQTFFLNDESSTDIREALQGVIDRDVSSLITFRVPGLLLTAV